MEVGTYAEIVACDCHIWLTADHRTTPLQLCLSAIDVFMPGGQLESFLVKTSIQVWWAW